MPRPIAGLVPLFRCLASALRLGLIHEPPAGLVHRPACELLLHRFDLAPADLVFSKAGDFYVRADQTRPSPTTACYCVYTWWKASRFRVNLLTRLVVRMPSYDRGVRGFLVHRCPVHPRPPLIDDAKALRGN